MASNSKSINLGGANVYIQRCTLTAYFNEESTSTSNNTSRIYVKASLYTPSASWDNGSGRDDHLRIYWHDNRENYDRHVATWSGSYVGVGSTITAGTIDVTHKDDGTLSGYAYATWSRDGGNTYYAPASGGVSTDWTGLTTIARASQPSINTYPTNSPDFDIGDTITIHMNRKSSSFTHTVTFNYGNTSVQVATGVTNSCTFDTSTIANGLYALIPNDNVYSSTISVKTYNGSTLIGTKTCAYNAHVVNSDPIFPDTTAGRIWVSNSNSIAQQTIGTYTFLQNVSIVRVGMRNASKAQAQNGASLVKMSCSFAGLYGEILAENIPSSGDIYFSLGTPTVYGLKTALLTATDSRGNSTTIAIQPFNSPNVPADNQYICPYANPSIVASAERQSNFENNTTISISGAMSSIKTYQGTTEKNAVDTTNGIRYRYKESTSSTWGSWTNVASTTAGDGSVSTTDFVISLDNQKEWDFEFKIIDKITSTTITRHVGQGQPQFFIGADGRTSVGGVPQIAMPAGNLGQLEVNGDVYSKGKLLMTLDRVYPVGSIFISTAHTSASDVATALGGGTWQAWGQGRVPVGVDTSDTGFDTVEETGGAKTHTHDLSNAYADLLMDASDGIYYREKAVTSWTANYKLNVTGGGGVSGSYNYGTALGGRTGSGSNLQPYITVYMWKRTA